MEFFIQIYNILVWFVVGFTLWGLVKATRAGHPEHREDRTYQIKTFWVIFCGAALWFVLWLIPLFHGVFVVTHFIAAIAMSYAGYRFNVTIKSLAR